MPKLNKAERKEYKQLKAMFKNHFPHMIEKEWEITNMFSPGTIDLYWRPFPGADFLFTRAVCSKNDVFNKKRGKLECLRKISNGVWLPC